MEASVIYPISTPPLFFQPVGPIPLPVSSVLGGTGGPDLIYTTSKTTENKRGGYYAYCRFSRGRYNMECLMVVAYTERKRCTGGCERGGGREQERQISGRSIWETAQKPLLEEHRYGSFAGPENKKD